MVVAAIICFMSLFEFYSLFKLQTTVFSTIHKEVNNIPGWKKALFVVPEQKWMSAKLECCKLPRLTYNLWRKCLRVKNANVIRGLHKIRQTSD